MVGDEEGKFEYNNGDEGNEDEDQEEHDENNQFDSDIDFSGKEEGDEVGVDWGKILSDISIEYDKNRVKETYGGISYQVAVYYKLLIGRGLPEERAFAMAMDLSSQLVALTLY